jgi:hypothetical protein
LLMRGYHPRSAASASLGQRSVSSEPVRRMTATASLKTGLACTIFACEPVRAKTWIVCMICFDRLRPTVIQGPQGGTWTPGYYSVLFEHPDDIRLEANFVPGAGVLQPGVKFNVATGYST